MQLDRLESKTKTIFRHLLFTGKIFCRLFNFLQMFPTQKRTNRKVAQNPSRLKIKSEYDSGPAIN